MAPPADNDETQRVNEIIQAQCYVRLEHALQTVNSAQRMIYANAVRIGKPTRNERHALTNALREIIILMADAVSAIETHHNNRNADLMILDQKEITASTRARPQQRTHTLAGTISNSPSQQLDRTGEYHEPHSPEKSTPHRHTDTK